MNPVMSLDLGGMFIDPNHFEAGTFKGLRMITDSDSGDSADKITLLGSDDA